MKPPYTLLNSLIMSFLFILLSFFSSCKDDATEPVPEPEIEIGLEYADVPCSLNENRKFIIEPSEWMFDGAAHEDIVGGDTVLIRNGARAGLLLTNVKGTEGSPIVFCNCDGKAELGQNLTSTGLNVTFSEHFKIAGTGSTSEQYGIQVRGYQAVEIAHLSTNYEVYAVRVIEAGYAGIVCRSDATCDGSVGISFTQRNTILHDNLVEDTGGEGFYIGGSHWGAGQDSQPGCTGLLIFEPQLSGVRVYNNRVFRAGRDAIQVGSAIEDCEIYNNYIEDFGQASEEGHMTGFQINPGTTGKLYNNVVNRGNGFGIFMVGKGNNLVYNNLIISPTFDGILAGDRTVDADASFMFINNTIINPGVNGYTSYTVLTSIWHNNIIVNPGNEFFAGDKIVESHNILATSADGLDFNDDYSLGADSEAIDAGMDVGASTDFNVTYDLLYHDRPSGEGYDIGAFEFVQ